MRRKIWCCLVVTIVLSLGLSLVSMADGYFDTSQIDKGVIKVTCNTGGKMKVMIKKGETQYTYDVNGNGQQESYPLQMGNGTYSVKLLQNTSGSSYKLIASTTVEMSLTDVNCVYLNSVQNVNWGVNQLSIDKATALTSGTTDLAKKAQILWDYMIKNNHYDEKKLASLPTTYLPVPDATLKEQAGICYDFASLYAAMLRSQGTPAKLVKGYAPKNAKGYHAWNEVYDTATGQWLVVDTTYDLQVYPKLKTVPMKKNAADFKKVYEY